MEKGFGACGQNSVTSKATEFDHDSRSMATIQASILHYSPGTSAIPRPWIFALVEDPARTRKPDTFHT